MIELKLCIYHANCVDGYTANWIAKRKYPGMSSMALTHAPMDLYLLESEMLKYHTVYILDYSLPLNLLRSVAAMDTNIVVLDHHKKAFDNYASEGGKFKSFSRDHGILTIQEPNLFIHIDMEKSGASMAWHHFFPDTALPKLVKYVEDRDLWRHKLDFSEEVAIYTSTLSHTLWGWNTLYLQLEEEKQFDSIVSQGQAMLFYRESLCEQAIKHSSDVKLCGIIGKAVNAPMQIASDVGNLLAKEYSTFGMVYTILNNGVVKVSLRGVGAVDVNDIAKKYGGGGHKNAAGYVTTLEDLEILLEELNQ